MKKAISEEAIREDAASYLYKIELLHMNFMVPMQVESLGGKKYVDVVVDDFSDILG
ncbi:gag-pol polyprotein [Trifolium pratense]|uniref:Gag-pol polyprotein n=1 Tax=Trifolium pratense TaxID=57577 RepID=A0A2K3JXJ0_TRIPR|nr:gag-pol polyprotein [Trifolium pratense]